MKSRSELKILWPIVICWLILMAIVVFFSAQIESGRSSAEMRVWANFGLTSTAALGIWVSVSWLVYYKPSTARLLLAPVLTSAVAFTYTGMFVYLMPQSAANYAWATAVLFSVAGVLFTNAFVLIRQLCGWQIVHESSPHPGASRARVGIKQLLVFTTLAAVAIALTLWLPRGLKVALAVASVVLPCLWMLIVMFLMARVRVWVTWVLSLFLAFAAAGIATWFFTVFEGGAKDALLTRVFLPNLVSFGVVGTGFLSIATYLRSHDILFLFGGEAGLARMSDNSPLLRSRVKLICNVALLLVAATGSWLVYNHWQLHYSRIPETPLATDIPRLFRIADYFPVHGKIGASQRERASERRRSAESALQGLGEQAVPFLWKQCTEFDTSDAAIRSANTALQMLQAIAHADQLGVHKNAIVSEMNQFLETDRKLRKDRAKQNLAVELLLSIGLPESQALIPVLKDRAQTPGDVYGAMNITRLIAISEKDALDSINQVLSNTEIFDLQHRANVAACLEMLSIDQRSAADQVIALLAEANIDLQIDKRSSTRTLEQVFNGLETVAPHATSAIPILNQIIEKTTLSPEEQRDLDRRNAGTSGSPVSGYGGDSYGSESGSTQEQKIHSRAAELIELIRNSSSP